MDSRSNFARVRTWPGNSSRLESRPMTTSPCISSSSTFSTSSTPRITPSATASSHRMESWSCEAPHSALWKMSRWGGTRRTSPVSSSRSRNNRASGGTLSRMTGLCDATMICRFRRSALRCSSSIACCCVYGCRPVSNSSIRTGASWSRETSFEIRRIDVERCFTMENHTVSPTAVSAARQGGGRRCRTSTRWAGCAARAPDDACQTRSTSNDARLRVSRLNSTATRWTGRPRPRCLSA